MKHVATILLLTASNTAFGQLWTQVQHAADLRRSQFQQFSCKLKMVHTVDRNELSFVDGNQVTEKKRVTYEFPITQTVDIVGKKFHVEERRPIFSEKYQVSFTRRLVHVHDSKNTFAFYPDDDYPFPGQRPVMIREVRASNPRLRDFATGPLFWQLGIFNSMDFLNGDITKLDELNFTWTKDGTLMKAEGSLDALHREFVFWFDPAQGFNVVQTEEAVKAANITANRILTYKEHKQGMWLLETAEYVSEKNGEQMVKELMTVSEFKATKVNDAQFQVPPEVINIRDPKELKKVLPLLGEAK